MRVTVEWSEETFYRSAVEVSDDAVREHAELDASAEVTIEHVRAYLADVDEAEWFAQADVIADYVGSQERSVDKIGSA